MDKCIDIDTVHGDEGLCHNVWHLCQAVIKNCIDEQHCATFDHAMLWNLQVLTRLIYQTCQKTNHTFSGLA